MHKRGFKLDQVLNFRQEVEKVRKLEFAAARHEFQKAAERLKREEDEANRLASEFNGKQAVGILATELQMYADFSRKKSADIRMQRRSVDSLDKKVMEKRETLLEAAKDKKVLETFKERKITVQKQELAEKERAFLDEIAIQRSGRDK
ncbi:MAG: flagellar FliJ [Geobacteraceae bacterium]|nr:MAG: flagellar FliJ [Geobacteraceae bacterium]